MTKRKFFTSVFFSAATAFVRVHPYADKIIRAAAGWVADLFAVPVWIVHLTFLACLTGCFYLLLYVSPVGPFLDRGFDWLVRKARVRIARPPFYTSEERDSGQFKEDIMRLSR